MLRTSYLLKTLLLIIPSSIGLGQDATSKNETRKNESSEESKKRVELWTKIESLKSQLKRHSEGMTWPAGIVVRIETNAEGLGKKGAESLKECWEYSKGQVHRVQIHYGETPRYEILESRPLSKTRLNPNRLFQYLLERRLVELYVDPVREGEMLMFAGTEFEVGHRTIAVWQNKKIIIIACESCLGGGFFESDAKDFAKLYERLAQGARLAFSKK